MFIYIVDFIKSCLEYSRFFHDKDFFFFNNTYKKLDKMINVPIYVQIQYTDFNSIVFNSINIVLCIRNKVNNDTINKIVISTDTCKYIDEYIKNKLGINNKNNIAIKILKV